MADVGPITDNIRLMRANDIDDVGKVGLIVGDTVVVTPAIGDEVGDNITISPDSILAMHPVRK